MGLTREYRRWWWVVISLEWESSKIQHTRRREYLLSIGDCVQTMLSGTWGVRTCWKFVKEGEHVALITRFHLSCCGAVLANHLKSQREEVRHYLSDLGLFGCFDSTVISVDTLLMGNLDFMRDMWVLGDYLSVRY